MQIKAFTLLESLLTLGIVSLLCWLLAGSVHQAFGQVEETLFFSEFERVYQETQKMSIAKEERTPLSIDHVGVHSPYQGLPLPKGWKWSEKATDLDPAGGNSSLTKIQFQTEKEVVTYQLAIGNGKIKKTTTPR
ncbi:MAG: competence type IV pilus minor pilin ComGD [Streptococcus sp.]